MPTKVLRLGGTALISFISFLYGAGVYMAYQHAGAYVAPSPSEIDVSSDFAYAIQGVAFAAGDGLTLTGWYVPPENGAVVLLLHGYGSNRAAMRFHIDALVEAGFGVLAYDLRAHGESEGDKRSLGWADVRDIPGALAFVQTQDADARIGALGFSIGGQIALRAAVIHPEIEAVFADGPSLANVRDRPINTWQDVFLLHPYNFVLDHFIALQSGERVPLALRNTIDEIAPRPILIVAGDYRDFYGAEADIAAGYVTAAGSNADLWVIPGAGHGAGPVITPLEYRQKMVSFFEETLILSQ